MYEGACIGGTGKLESCVPALSVAMMRGAMRLEVIGTLRWTPHHGPPGPGPPHARAHDSEPMGCRGDNGCTVLLI